MHFGQRFSKLYFFFHVLWFQGMPYWNTALTKVMQGTLVLNLLIMSMQLSHTKTQHAYMHELWLQCSPSMYTSCKHTTIYHLPNIR